MRILLIVILSRILEQKAWWVKRSVGLTGPVITLLDLVVHVPVSCGSVCADTKVTSTAPKPTDNCSDRIMKCIC